MAQEETETKINNYNPAKGFMNKTRYDNSTRHSTDGCFGSRHTSVVVPWENVAFGTTLRPECCAASCFGRSVRCK